MTQKGAIKWANEIKAFQEGKQIQRQTRGVWFDEKSPRFEEDVEYRIKPEPTKRLPTIEEVEKWFLENKVFFLKPSKCYMRILSFTKYPCDKSKEYICLSNRAWVSIEQFCKNFTHYDGSELYITE